MNTFPLDPPRFLWTPQQLADAVPLRLHQMIRFDARGNPAAANAASSRRRNVGSYLPNAGPYRPFRFS